MALTFFINTHIPAELPPSLEKTYLITAPTNSVNEGETINFMVNTTNVTDNTILKWDLYHIDNTTNINDFTHDLSGDVSIVNNMGNISINITSDNFTEGEESFVVQLVSIEGEILATSNTVTVQDTSKNPATYLLTHDKTDINENDVINFTVNTTNVPDNTKLYWEIVSQTGIIDATDFINGLTGEITIIDNTVTFSINTSNDFSLEGNESFIVNIKKHPTLGPTVLTSSVITISDTSVPTYEFVFNKTVISEDDVLSVTINTQGVNDNTALHWEIIKVTGTITVSDFVSNLTGTVNINSGTASFNIITNPDVTLEGTESFKIVLHTDSLLGPNVAESIVITISDTSVPPTYKITPDKLVTYELSPIVFTIETTDIPDGTTLFYTILHPIFLSSRESEWYEPSGPFIIDGGTATITLTPRFALENNPPTNNSNLIAVKTGSTTGTTVASCIVQVLNTDIQVDTKLQVTDNETVPVNLTTVGLPDGTVLYWNITTRDNNAVASDFLGGVLPSGYVTINNNTASFEYTTYPNLGEEGQEYFYINIRVGSPTGVALWGVDAPSYYKVVYTILDSYVITANKTTLTEDNDVLICTVNTNGIIDGTVINWVVEGPGVNADDFVTPNNGQVTITGNIGTIQLTTKPDAIGELEEQFRVRLKVSNIYVASTAYITIQNTSSRTVTVTSPTDTITELDSITFTITGNIPDNTTLYWTIGNISGTIVKEDFLNSIANGTFVMNGGTHSVTVNLRDDNAFTEQNEVFEFQVRDLSSTGLVIGSKQITVINLPYISADRTTVYESDDITFTITSYGWPDGTTVYWDIQQVSGTIEALEFVQGISGSVDVNNNTADVIITPINDLIREGTESFVFRVRWGSPTGTIMRSSETISLRDKYNITASRYAISENTQTIIATVSTSNVSNNVVLHWRITPVTTTVDNFDFSTPILGDVTINNNTGTFNITTIADLTTEGDETFIIELYLDAGYTTKIAYSDNITVIDTSNSDSLAVYERDNVFLMKTSSTNNANNTTIKDSSIYNATITNIGTPIQGTFNPFIDNRWSAFFGGSNYSRLPTNAMNLGSNNFTIEAWVYMTNMPTSDLWPSNWTQWFVVVGRGTADSGDGFNFMIGSTILGVHDTNVLYTNNEPHNMVINTWYHLACVKNNNELKFFINGQQSGAAFAHNKSVGTGSYTFIGSETGQGAFFKGYISNIRVVNQTALYTANFTPSTEPLTAITNTLLLACNSDKGEDISTNKYISSYTNLELSRYTPFTQFESGSWYFNGTTSYASIAASNTNKLHLDSNNFTIETWFMAKQLTAGTIFALNSSSFAAVRLDLTTTGGLTLKMSTDGSNWTIDANSSTKLISLLTWNHIAVSRNGSNILVFVNGNVVINTTISGSLMTTYTHNLIGAINTGAYANYINGFISNFRIIKGTAVYTSNFTPNTTTRLPITTETVFISCYTNIFADISPLPLSITVNNIQPHDSSYLSPFMLTADNNPSSVYLDGSSSHMTVPASTTYIPAGDFTLELWAYMTVYRAQVLISLWSGTASTSSWTLYTDSSDGTKLILSVSNGSNWVDLITSTGTIIINKWTHIAVVVQGTTLKIFSNGNVVYTGTAPTFFSTSSTALAIGNTAPGTSTRFTGYMSNIRIVKGTAVYTDAFTPPTQPLSAILNTTFLMSNSILGVYDLTNNSNIVTLSTATSNTTTKKFDSSLYIPNTTGVYAYVRPYKNSLFKFGLEDFTLEGWVNTTVNTSNRPIIDFRSIASQAAPTFYLKSNKLAYLVNGTDVIVGTTTIALNTWYHFAVVRYLGVTKLYVNGVAEGTAYTDTNDYIANTNRPYIGAWGDTSIGGAGIYLEDIRITKHRARYITNFNVPMTPYGISVSLIGFSLSVNKNLITESTDTLTFTINSLYNSSVTLYWNLVSLTGTVNTSDISPFSGSVKLNNKIGTVILTSIADYITEGTESFKFVLYAGSIGGTFIAETDPITITDDARVDLSVNTTTINEDDDELIITLTTPNNSTGYTFYWQIITQTGVIDSSDVDNLSGSVLMSGNTGTITIKTLADFATDGVDTFKVRIYTGSVGGTQVAETPEITILDTSQAFAGLEDNQDILLKVTGVETLTNESVIDASYYNNTISLIGEIGQGPFTPFEDSWCASFDSSGDSVKVGTSPYFGGTFTIESWVYLPTNYNQNTHYICSGLYGSKAFYRIIFLSGGKVSFQTSGGGWSWSTTATPPDILITGGLWHYVTFVFKPNGTNVLVDTFIDGVKRLTDTNIGTCQGGTISSDSLYFGSYYGVSPWAQIKIKDFRLTSGILYTNNFKVPTETLTSLPDTRLLLFTSRIFEDVSPLNHTSLITTVGNPDIITCKVFSTKLRDTYYSIDNYGSLFFIGTTGNYLTVPNTVLNPLIPNYTIEAYIYTSLDTVQTIITSRSTATAFDTPLLLQLDANQIIKLYVSYNGSTWGINAAIMSSSLTIYTWHHIALVKSDMTYSVYVNGVLTGTTTAVSKPFTTSNNIIIGGDTNGNPYGGYITDLRISDIVRYSSNFTPPNSYTISDKYTTLLLRGQGATLFDEQHRLNVYGNATTNTTTKLFNGSMYFNGATSFKLPRCSLLALGMGDFTIEFWTYPTSLTNAPAFIDFRPLNGNGVYPLIYNDGTKMIYYVSTGARINSTINIPLNTWTHIAVCRSNGVTKMYINGTQSGGNYADTNYYLCNPTVVYIGQASSTSTPRYLNGYMEEVNIITATAKYTANFTPPSTSLITVPDTITTGFSVTANKSVVTELDDPITFTISSTDVANTRLYWKIKAITGIMSSNDMNLLDGAVDINNGTATFIVKTILDNITEGTESFKLELYTTSLYDAKVAESSSIQIQDTSVTLTPNKIIMNEDNDTVTFTITLTNTTKASTFTWEILPISDNLNSSDFLTAMSGSGTFTNNIGSFNITAIPDISTLEFAETFKVRVNIEDFYIISETITVLDSSAILGKAYFAGGSSGLTADNNNNLIDGISFSTDVGFTTSTVLATARRNFCGFSSPTIGYHAGGGAGGYISGYTLELDGIRFTDETAVNPTSTLSARTAYAGSMYTQYFGYAYGGFYADGNVYATLTLHNKFNYSTETRTTLTAMPAGRSTMACIFDTQQGFLCGGSSGGSITNATTLVMNVNFATESVATDTTTISARQAGTGTTNMGQSIGYICGGYNGTINLNTIQRFDMSTKSTAIHSSSLTSYRRGPFGTRSSLAGYIVGGSEDSTNSHYPPVASADKLLFSTETCTSLSNILSLARKRGATAEF